MCSFPEPCTGLASDRQGPSQQDSFWLSSHSNHPKWAGVKTEELGEKGGGKQEGCLRKNWEAGEPYAQTHCGMVCAAQHINAWISLGNGRLPPNPGLLWAATTFPESSKSPPFPVCKGLGSRRPNCPKEPVASGLRLPLVFLLWAVLNSILHCRRKSLCGGSHTVEQNFPIDKIPHKPSCLLVYLHKLKRRALHVCLHVCLCENAGERLTCCNEHFKQNNIIIRIFLPWAGWELNM